MIVWINGSFGAGKTTLADELHRRWPETLRYDPELVGMLLLRIVEAPTGDFQDLPLWRRQVASLAVGLVREYERPVLAPMTLIDPGYQKEIFGELDAAGVEVAHFFLKVPAATLEQRIDQREVAGGAPEREASIRGWAKARIARCVAAAEHLPPGTLVLDGTRPTSDLAADVLRHVHPTHG